jgi:hypothetical protein
VNNSDTIEGYHSNPRWKYGITYSPDATSFINTRTGIVPGSSTSTILIPHSYTALEHSPQALERHDFIYIVLPDSDAGEIAEAKYEMNEFETARGSN